MERKQNNKGPKNPSNKPKDILTRASKLHPKNGDPSTAGDVTESNIAKTETEKGNIIIVDTNILVNDPNNVNLLRSGGNLLVIPGMVLEELDNLKTSSVAGFDAREAIRLIYDIIDLSQDESGLYIERSQDSTGLSLNRNNADNQIIFTVNFILKQSIKQNGLYYGYKKIKFLSNDKVVGIKSKTIFKGGNLIIEPLLKDRTEKIKKVSIRTLLLKIELADLSKVVNGDYYIPYLPKYKLIENEAIIFKTKFDLVKKEKTEELKPRFLGIRKGEKVVLVTPDITLYGKGPLSNGKVNWAQVHAIHLLKDKEVHAIFLQGGAGTGKTFLALSGSLEIKKESKALKDIYVCRVTEPLDKNQAIGWTKGGVDEKMAPWMLPIIQNLSILEKDLNASKKSHDEKNISAMERLEIYIQTLDYIRGATFRNTVIIVDEAQNLSPHQIKTIITRAGVGTKIIFTGDLSQIDNQSLDKKSSGLTYVINRLLGQKLIGVVNFSDVVRSPLAELAEKLL